jgi:acylaminoacyl-peptidase
MPMLSEVEQLYQALKQQPIVEAGSILTLKEGRELNFALQSTFLDSYGQKKRQAVQYISLNPAILTPFSDNHQHEATENEATVSEFSLNEIKNICPTALHLWTDPVIQSDCIKQTIFAPSGHYRLVFMMEEKGEASKDARSPGKMAWLEIWQKHYRVAVISGKDLYQDLYQDTTIGAFAWNHDETKCLFIASPVKTFSNSAVNSSSTAATSNEQSSSAMDSIQGNKALDIEKYKYESTYGETYSAMQAPRLFVLDLVRQEISKLDTHTIDPFEALFYKHHSKDAQECIYFIGLNVKKYPKRPGLSACPNRPTQLYRYDAGGHVALMPVPFSSLSQLRKSNINNKIYFLAGISGGPHKSSNQLIEMTIPATWDAFTTRAIVDLIRRPDNNSFPGIFTPIGSGLPTRPFLFSKLEENLTTKETDRHSWLIMTSIWHSRTTILLVDLENTNQVIDLTPQTPTISWSVLDVYQGYILANYQTFNGLPKTVIGKVDLQLASKKVQWFHVHDVSDSEHSHNHSPLVSMNPYSDLFPWLASNTQIALQWHHGDSGTFQSIFVFPKNFSPFKPAMKNTNKPNEDRDVSFSPLSTLPLIVIPHGGPHSTALCIWHFTVAALLSRGIAVLFSILRTVFLLYLSHMVV